MIMNWHNLYNWLPGFRASLENPSTSLGDPDAWLLDIFGGKSSSGISVNRDTALAWSALFRGIRLVSETVARLPTNVLKRTSDGGKDKDKSHPAHNLVRHNATDEITSFVFKSAMQANAMLIGNAYAAINRDSNNDPASLVLLDPLRVTPERVGGRLIYWHEDDNTKPQPILPENMLHIKGIGLDGITGISIVERGRESIGLPLAMQGFASTFFANNAQPSLAIEMEGTPEADTIKQLREHWASRHGGVNRSSVPAILTGGMKIKPFSQTAEDAQLIESRKFSLTDAANWCNVPVHKVGGDGRTAFASLEAENRSFLDESIDPVLVNWEQECRTKLLRESEKETDSHLVSFNRQALLAADVKTTSETLVAEVNNGILTVNEARAVQDLPPTEDGEGDRYRKPENIGFVDDQDEPEEQPEPPPEIPAEPEPESDPEDDEARKLADMAKNIAVQGTLDALGRMCRRLSVNACKAAKKSQTFGDWLASVRADHHAQLAEVLGTPVGSLCVAHGVRDTAPVVQAASDAVFHRMIELLTTLYDTTSRDDFPAAVADAMAGYESKAPAAILSQLQIQIERLNLGQK